MSEPFDPYYKWLAIPPHEQPANHYRLLGVRVFEQDPDVIESAADQRMAHLRSMQSGERSALSQKLLNEVAAARQCLLHSQRRAAYDAELRRKIQAVPLAQIASPVSPTPTVQPLAARTPVPQPFGGSPLALLPAGANAPAKRSWLPLIIAGAIAVPCVIALPIVVIVLSSRSRDDSRDVQLSDKYSEDRVDRNLLPPVEPKTSLPPAVPLVPPDPLPSDEPVKSDEPADPQVAPEPVVEQPLISFTSKRLFDPLEFDAAKMAKRPRVAEEQRPLWEKLQGNNRIHVGCDDNGQIRRIGLSGDSIHTDILAILQHVDSLEELELRSIPSLTDGQMAVLATLPSLEQLIIFDCDNFSSDALEHLSTLTKLQSLQLSGCAGVTDDSIRHLVRLSSLERLNLTQTGITDAGLAQIAQLAELRELSIAQCKITDSGLANLARLPKLQSLDLRDSPQLTDAAADSLVQITSVQTLLLSSNLIFNTSNRPAGRGGVSFTDAGLIKLASQRNLRLVDVVQCQKITSQGVAQFRSKLPICQVFYTGNDRFEAQRMAAEAERRETALAAVFAFSGGEHQDRLAALKALEQAEVWWVRDVPTVAQSLTRCLDDPSSEIRLGACRTLARIGDSAKSAVPSLARLVKTDDDERVRAAALKTLLYPGRETEELQSIFVEILLGGADEQPRSLSAKQTIVRENQRWACFVVVDRRWKSDWLMSPLQALMDQAATMLDDAHYATVFRLSTRGLAQVAFSDDEFVAQLRKLESGEGLTTDQPAVKSAAMDSAAASLRWTNYERKLASGETFYVVRQSSVPEVMLSNLPGGRASGFAFPEMNSSPSGTTKREAGPDKTPIVIRWSNRQITSVTANGVALPRVDVELP